VSPFKELEQLPWAIFSRSMGVEEHVGQSQQLIIGLINGTMEITMRFFFFAVQGLPGVGR
jgi:hypothetical protein